MRLKVLIVDDAKNIKTVEGEIVIVLKDPQEFPAIIRYPQDADIESWHVVHDAMLAQRERDTNYGY